MENVVHFAACAWLIGCASFAAGQDNEPSSAPILFQYDAVAACPSADEARSLLEPYASQQTLRVQIVEDGESLLAIVERGSTRGTPVQGATCLQVLERVRASLAPAVEPQAVASNADKPRGLELDWRTDEAGLSLHRVTGRERESYHDGNTNHVHINVLTETVCELPCTTELPAGTYELQVFRGNGVVATSGAFRSLQFEHNETLRIYRESRADLRNMGLVVLAATVVLGVVAGIVAGETDGVMQDVAGWTLFGVVVAGLPTGFILVGLRDFLELERSAPQRSDEEIQNGLLRAQLSF